MKVIIDLEKFSSALKVEVSKDNEAFVPVSAVARALAVSQSADMSPTPQEVIEGMGAITNGIKKSLL